MKICMFVKNSFEYDARVTKEAKTLIGAGHDVTVIALLVPGVTPEREETNDGISVIRVPRSSFGVPALNRLAQRYAGTIEARHERLTGETYNEERVAELGTFSAPSTATPGEPLTPRRRDSPRPPTAPTAASAAWGRITTPVLRSLARLARWGFRLAKRLLGQQSQQLKQRAIDRRMTKLGVESGADVFHCHDLNTLGIGVACKERVGGLLVYDSHELQSERNRMTPQARADAIEEEGRCLPHVDAMIVASPSWIDWNRDLHGTLPDPTVTVLNVPERTPIDVTKDLRSELDIARNHPIVIYQGSIQENRGIEPAIDAVASLEDVVLVIIGYGYHKQALESLVRSRGLEDRVRFFGPVPNDELISYSASADVGLANIVNSSVSYHTSLPNKLFEYVMAEIPVVGSDSPEIGRIVSEYRVGEVADAEDPWQLAEAIRTILGKGDAYRPALRRASERFNWEVERSTLLELYDTLERRMREIGT